MKTLLIVALSCFAAAVETAPESGAAAPPPGAKEPFPKELANFQALVDNEEALVNAVRDFDRLQQGMAEWDVDLAKQYAINRDKELADNKFDQSAKRYDLIRLAYQELLARYPNNARANNYYGEFLYDVDHDEAKALQQWHLARKLDTKYSQPWNNLAIHHCHVGDYTQGLKYYDKALELDPDNPDYLYNLTQTYFIHFPAVQKARGWDKPRVFKEAMKLSRKASALDPTDFELLKDYAVNFFAAEQFDSEVDWKDAAKAWQAARPFAPGTDDLFYTWLNEARAWMLAKNNDEALRCLDQALAINSESTVANQLRAKVLQRRDGKE